MRADFGKGNATSRERRKGELVDLWWLPQVTAVR